MANNNMLSHGQKDNNNFLCTGDRTRYTSKPAGRNTAVYLLLNASPIKIPASNQQPFLFWKMALYKAIKESVQKSNNGTSGVATNDNTEISTVENNRMVACTTPLMFIKQVARKTNAASVQNVTRVIASFITNTFFPSKEVNNHNSQAIPEGWSK